MIRKIPYYIFIVILSLFPIIGEALLHFYYGNHYSFIWSLYLIPIVIIIHRKPNWRTLVITGLFYSLLNLCIEIIISSVTTQIELIIYISALFINWAILVTIGYFRIKYETLVKRFENMTILDPLTGLFNRRYFEMYMGRMIPYVKESNQPLSLILIDIDYFKEINDTYGHQCGDEVLKTIAEIIKKCVKLSDGYVRYGGEEFAVMLADTSLKDAKIIAERIRQTIEKTTIHYENFKVKVTVSVGVTQYDSGTVTCFVELADQALYKAKANGRNQVVAI